MDSKNLSGKVFLNGEGKVELKEVTDGTYSAEGTLDDLSVLKGTIEDLLANRLEINVNVITNARNIIITVERIDGVPTSYSYQITGPDNYKQEANNLTDNTYTFEKLKIDTEYKIKVTVKNKAGLTKEITKSIRTEKIENPSISIRHTPSNASLTTTNGYSKEEIASVTFSNKNITNPTYYIKSTLNGTTNVNVLASCTEENSKQKTCTDVDTNSIKANTWYKVSGDINITYSEETNTPATIYAITYDGTNYSNSSTGTTLKIDKVGPNYTALVSERNIIITANDDKSGLHASTYSCDGVWQTSNICKFTTEGNHTVNVRDASENEGTAKTINILVTSPALGNLTPVVYQNNKWIVADTTTKWYDYDKQQWANAVLLNKGITKATGQELDLTKDVRAMFVWIPRYEYKIDGLYCKGGISAESPGEIEVNFISKDVVYENANSSGYRVHPAFWWDNNSNGIRETGEELSGIWVGKFEPSTEKTSECYLNPSLENCDNENQEPYILPNVSSLRNQNPKNQFETAKKLNNLMDKTSDSHMMKNSEWGAAAYLSQSRYGKYGLDAEEIYINNCSNYTTGTAGDAVDSAKTSSCVNTYETQKGQKASTTGNITGIYDMSGGAWERVMAYYEPAYQINPDLKLPWGSTSTDGSSGFTSAPASKYYDSYISELPETTCGGGVCYGHALSETAGWYSGYTKFFTNSKTWINRGAHLSNIKYTSIFSFHQNGAYAHIDGSFRIVIS